MVYFDNASTTKPKHFASNWNDVWGNPNSQYKFGFKAKSYLDSARNVVKNLIGAKSGIVIFGNNATHLVETIMPRIESYLTYGSVCDEYEHDCVYNNATYHATKDEFIADYGPSAFYFNQYVNNVTGKVFDVVNIGKEIHTHNSFFACDMTAAIGKIGIPKDIDDWCDIAFFSGHKFNVVGGGAMWISKMACEFLHINISDSKDEYGLIRGTPCVPMALALCDGLENAVAPNKLQKRRQHYRKLFEHMYTELKATDADDSCVDGISAWIVEGANADALQQYLSTKDIYVGIGASACSEAHDYRVLEAQGFNKEDCENTIRISFSEDNTLADIDELVEAINEFKKKFC